MSSPLRILIAGITGLVLLTSAFSNDLLPNPPNLIPHGTGGGLVILPGQTQAMFSASAGEDVRIDLPGSMEGSVVATSLSGAHAGHSALIGSTLLLRGAELGEVYEAGVTTFEIMVIAPSGHWLGATVEFDGQGNVTVRVR